jgi:hypothetical protein
MPTMLKPVARSDIVYPTRTSDKPILIYRDRIMIDGGYVDDIR